MFNPTERQLWQEVQEAERLRDEKVRGVSGIITEYVGRWYHAPDTWGSETQGFDDYDINPEPFSYSFVTNLLPSLIFDLPQCNVRARRVIGHAEISQAMESGINALVQDIDYRSHAERATLSMMFLRGILLHYLEDDTRWSNGAVRPNCESLDFRHFFMDSMASKVDEAEFMGHCYWVDIDDIQSDPAADPEVVKMIQPKTQSNEHDTLEQTFERGADGMLGRKRTKLYSIWLRRLNQIRVLVETGNSARDLYPPRDYYGPPTGPYVLFDAYPVPNETTPLSPLVAVRDQVLDLQRHAKASSRSAAGRKTIVIVAGEQNDLADDVKDAVDREIIEVKGFSRDQIEQVELGGMTPIQYQYLGLLRERLDQHSGLTQTMRGASGQADTATEASIMDQALSSRIEYLKQRVRHAVAKSLETFGWFLFHTNGIIIPVTLTDQSTGMETEGLFFGGPTPGQSAGSWYDYSIDIQPYSMQRESEQAKQRRVLDYVNLVSSMAPQMLQFPHVKWLALMREAGEAINMEDPERFFNHQMMLQLQQMASQQMQLTSTYLGGAQADAPPDRFSLPGLGFQGRMSEEMSVASPAVDEGKRDIGANYGMMGGGRQGPPGSRQGLVPGRPSS